MIGWVEQRLIQWGEFSNGSTGVGGGGAFPAYQLVHVQGGDSRSAMLVSADVLEIDTLMAGVKLQRMDLFDTAWWLYVSGVSPQYTAEKMKCHINTVFNRRNSLHEYIKNCLCV